MKIKSFILLLCAALPLFAARAPIQQALTSTGVAFKYSRPDAVTCTWEASTSATFTPLADSGPDSGVQGTRWFVLGASTPLAASTHYYWRQTCDAEVYTGQFTTLVTVTPVVTTTSFSSGGHPYANKARLEYGLTPALGSSIDADCTPLCQVTGIPITKDSFLFVKLSYLNETDVVATGEIRLVVSR